VQLLFSYGSLRHEDVQLSTFGRRLDGVADELVGFELSSVKIDDLQIAETLGQTHYANVTHNGRPGSHVAGVALEVTDEELLTADLYEETASYVRMASTLASGRVAWVYLDSRSDQAIKMNSINYEGRSFCSVRNSAHGDVSDATRFDYRQRGEVVWATYEGGDVWFGTLIATIDNLRQLDMRYSHVNLRGELRTGECRSVPELLPDGRLRLHETWRWTNGDVAEGSSVIEEVESQR
jgi:hypothetical protein